MAAYFVADVTFHDPRAYAEHRAQVGPLLARHGGRFLVRGGATETIEGNGQPQRLGIIEFADTDHLWAWYESPEYAELRTLRFNASTAQALLAQGGEPGDGV